MHNGHMTAQEAYERREAYIPVWEFSDKLRKARQTMRMSQEQFAQAINIKASTYSAYESGRAMPRMRDSNAIAHRLQMLTKIPAEWFLVTEDPNGGDNGSHLGESNSGPIHYKCNGSNVIPLSRKLAA